MNKRYFAIAIIVISLLLIVGIVYFFFFYRFQAPDETALNQPSSEETPTAATTGTAVTPTSQTSQPAVRVRKEEMGQEDLKRMAGSFAERFGSYSNQSDFSNVEDLMIFMTAEMKAWAGGFVNDSARKTGDLSIYYGISTKAVTEEVKKYDKDAGQAEILVKNQRREAAGKMSNASAFYQDIIIRFVKEGGAWKVDAAVWQTK